MTNGEGTLRFQSAQGRWVIFATVLGSGIAFLDSTVVNVALPAISETFRAGVAEIQWTIEAYLLTLGSLLLLGGSLGDLLGRRRMFVAGLGSFTIASVLCGLAPSAPFLILGRGLQGIGAALLVPGSLAIIQASFHPDDRGRAIGSWSGLAGVTTALGPFLGGYLIDAFSWRLVFFINVPLAIVAIGAALKHVPESRDEEAGRPDVLGSLAIILGLGGVIYALIEGPGGGFARPAVIVALAVGVLGIISFFVLESTIDQPMMPLSIFRSAQFSATNGLTLLVYFALGGAMFLTVIQLQRVLGYSALEAGMAFLPTTIVLMLLSAKTGALAQRIGPRLPLTVGPIGAALGLALLARMGAGSHYLTDMLPAVMLFSLGLAFTVAPLTTAVLAAVETRHAGVASGVNNAVARIASLLAVALLPAFAGIAGEGGLGPRVFAAGYPTAIVIAAALCAGGGLIAFAFVRSAHRERVHVPPSIDQPCSSEREPVAVGAESRA